MRPEINLKIFLDDYGESLAEKVTKDLNVVHDPAKDEEAELDHKMDQLLKNPFPAQREIIKAVYKSFQAGNKAVYMAAEMGTGKTLSAIELMEKSNASEWWWVAPKSGLAAVEREFVKWDLKVQPKLMTYDRLRIDIERWEEGAPAPQGVIFDESSRLKTANAKRTKAAQHLADSHKMHSTTQSAERAGPPRTSCPSPPYLQVARGKTDTKT